MTRAKTTRLEGALQRVLLVAVLAIPVIPCVVSRSFATPYVSVKGHLLRLLVDLAVICWAGLVVMRPAARPRSSPLLVAGVVFVAVIGLADVVGVCPARSLLGNLERMEGWFTSLHLLGLFLVLPAALSSERLWRWFFAISLAASVVVTAVAFGQLAGVAPMDSPQGRIDGTLGNPTFLAAYLAFHIWLVCYLLVRDPGAARWRPVGIGIVVLEGAALFFSATRGAMLGLAAAGVVALVVALANAREWRRLRRLAAVVVVIALLLVTGLVAMKEHVIVASSPTLSRMAAISPSGMTTSGRLLAWRAALDGAAERPLLGWGQENFSIVYARHYDPRLYTHEPFFDRVHNVFLQWLVAGGFPGLIAYCAILWSFLWVVWRGRCFSGAERSLLTGLMAGYVVHTSVLFDTLTSSILATAMCAYVHWRYTGKRPSRERLGRLAWAPAAALLAVAAVLAAGLTLRTVAAERSLMAAIVPDPRGLEGNLESFRRALRHRTAATPKVRERLLTTAVKIARSGPQDPDTMRALNTLAVEEMAQQISDWPLDVRSQVALASFLWRFGAHEDAEGILRHAHELAPRMQHILFELGAVQLSHGEPDLALDTLRTAYELAPKWGLARRRYAAAAIAAGQRALAKKLLIPVEGTIAVGDEWIINALRASGDLPNLAKALRWRIGTQRLDGQDVSALESELEEVRETIAERRAQRQAKAGGATTETAGEE